MRLTTVRFQGCHGMEVGVGYLKCFDDTLTQVSSPWLISEVLFGILLANDKENRREEVSLIQWTREVAWCMLTDQERTPQPLGP